MVRKINTIPFGAEIPPDLAEKFDEVIDESGWTKKRALAAAVRAFCKLDESTRADLYKKAYDKLK
ncbi:MAG TPA: hypothetical protein PLK08_08170 [Phycisphaerae bacterium]|nr:hypothetical protein [Phycisphaerae bacterium]